MDAFIPTAFKVIKENYIKVVTSSYVLLTNQHMKRTINQLEGDQHWWKINKHKKQYFSYLLRKL